MVQEHNIPQGYKQTELGIIPEDWEVKQISDFTSVVTGGTPSTQHPEYWGGDIRWMNSGELNLKFVYDVEGRITEEGLHNSSTHVIPAECVLVGLAGQGKTRGTAAYNLVSLCTNQSIAAFLPTDKHSSLYLYYVIDSKYDYLRLLSSGDGGRGGLNKQILSTLNVVLPPIAEQRAIAEALSDVDGLIAALDKKIAKKRFIKQGAMQQLLTGKTRLPGFTDEWMQIRLEDYYNIVAGGDLDLNSYSPYKTKECKYPIYSNSLDNRGLYGYTSNPKYGENSITITGRGSLGHAEYRTTRFDAIVRLIVMKPLYNNICGLYITELINCISPFVFESTGVPQLTSPQVGATTLKIPKSLAEQQTIATILSDMDKEIADLEAQRDKYRLLKSGMMQKLLTGQIRLKTE